MKNSLLLLGEFSDQDMDWLQQVGKQVQVAANEVVVKEGQPIESLYILLKGRLEVKASLGGEEPRLCRIARLTAGEIIGEMSFVDHRPPSATVIAETDSVLLAIPSQLLAQKADQDVAFGRRFYRGLAYCLSNRLRLMNVSLPQAGIEVSGKLPSEMINPDVETHLDAARARLELLMETAH